MGIKFIAEVSSNHNRDLDRSLKFIETASKIGCDGIKFQLFKVDKLFAPQILKKSLEHNKRRLWELPVEYIPKLSKRSRALGIKFSCTPFYIEAVDEIKPYVDFLKIASYQLLWDDMLKKCAVTKLPVVLSVGMATICEIDRAVEILRDFGSKDITLLHCVSVYPVKANVCNLAFMDVLKKRYRVKVGWSDHSVSPGILYRAAYKWNASMIEFHLDIDGKGKEFNIGHCWLAEDICKIIYNVRRNKYSLDNVIEADGTDERLFTYDELEERQWRTDPSDGLRPLEHIRNNWRKK